MAETIYGLLLIIFIIFLPSGIYGASAMPSAAAPPARPVRRCSLARGLPPGVAHGAVERVSR